MAEPNRAAARGGRGVAGGDGWLPRADSREPGRLPPRTDQIAGQPRAPVVRDWEEGRGGAAVAGGDHRLQGADGCESDRIPPRTGKVTDQPRTHAGRGRKARRGGGSV